MGDARMSAIALGKEVANDNIKRVKSYGANVYHSMWTCESASRGRSPRKFISCLQPKTSPNQRGAARGKQSQASRRGGRVTSQTSPHAHLPVSRAQLDVLTGFRISIAHARRDLKR